VTIDKYIESHPVTIAPDTLLKNAVVLLAQQQAENKPRCLLIVAANQLIGILTQSDVVRLVATETDLATTTVKQVMTQPVLTRLRSQCYDLDSAQLFFQQHLISYLPILDENQQLVGMIDSKSLIQLPTLQAEQELDHNHNQQQVWYEKGEQLGHFFDSTPSMICVAGLDGYFKWINPALLKNLGFMDGELLTQPFINFVHPEDCAATLAEVEKLSAGKTTVAFENRYRTKNGAYRWFLWTAKPDLKKQTIFCVVQDITEQKQATALLNESYKQFRLLAQKAPVGIFQTDAEGNCLYVNARWQKLTGLSEQEAMGMGWSNALHPEDRARVIAQWHQCTQTGQEFFLEYRFKTPDNQVVWVSGSAGAYYNDAGEIQGYLGTVTDITEQQIALQKRQQAEQRLAQSENLLRTIIESEPECVKMLADDGRLLEMNPAGLAMIEADSLAEVIDKPVYSLINPNHRQAFVKLTESIFEGKSGKLEFELTGLKGTSRWLETHAVPFKTGNEINALLAVTRDITQRKEAELQLRQERDFSKAVINTVGALVAVLNRQGVIVSFNHTCEQVTGYYFEEVQGKQVWDFLIPAEEKATSKAIFERLLEGQFHNQYENHWIAKDGRQNLISWSNTALFDAQGEIEFIIATGIDVTEQRRVWNKLEFQYRQTKLLTEITGKIRMSIELDEILQTAVTEVQHLLACDRVLIVEIKSNSTVMPISEAILPDLPPMLDYELADPLLVGEYLTRYHQGEVLAIDNLATAPIDRDIKQLLKQFQVQAKLVVPILAQGKLQGLLIAHQCHHPRQWQQEEIQLLNQLADQLGVALSQAQLLSYAEKLALERTKELSATNELLQAEISEREQTEQDLRENQQKLAGILDNADEAIITINEQQQIQLFNQGAEKIFGYQAQEILGQPLDLLLPEIFRQIHRHHIRQFAKLPEKSRQMTERNTNVYGRRKDGHEFSAEASVAKLQTNSGMLFTVMLKDISERQQTLEKLQTSQALLAKAEKIAKIGSWEYDYETKKRSWSEELFNILGFDSNLPIPSCPEILAHIHPEDRLLVKNTLVERHGSGQSWELDYRLLLPDGTIKYIESRGEPTVNSEGKVLKVLETITDVSDRIAAEKSLQRSEEQLKLITDALPVLIAYIDQEQRYIYNNRTYETWYGIPRSTLQGKAIEELVGEKNYQKMLPYIKTALGGKTVTFETQPITNNGSSYWMNATYVPDFDSDGKVKGFFSMVEDITERKAVEQMKSEFISIASHEMRTPLTSIHGVVKLLCAGRLGELSESGSKMADMALRNSDRLIRLVNDILDLERMESGSDEINQQPCDSAELIRQAIDTTRPLADEQKISLEADAQSLEFLGDRDRLVQTLSNLISNAIKFSPAHSSIKISSKLEGQNVLFSVQDWGRGIPRNKLENIFERFQQVDASDSRQKGGTGLGLAICLHIIEQHQGKIWVESVYGQGSTFYFLIPQQ
jgi:PAS domain S-box-containing protein